MAGRVVRGEGGAGAADGPRVFMAQEISPLPCLSQGPGEKHNNKQGVMMMMKMKRVTLNRNGRKLPNARETSDLKAGRFTLGQHVMLSITGDCCDHSKLFQEYVVADIKPCNRFGGGRETITFERVIKDL